MPDDLAPRGFYEGLTARSLMAGWARREQQHTGSQSEMHVHVWRAAEAQTALQEASRFVGTDVAERRNLIMVNPAPGNTYATTRNLVAAYQMIQPGETARSHRHTPAALRLVLDAANDVYTVVDGKRVDMTPGDVVLTPSWRWHGHANEGGESAFWLDFLDVPFVRHVEAMFFEHHPDAFQRPTQRDSTYRIPLGTVLADQTGMYSVEIAKDVMPTIGLHAIRLSSGAVTERLHQTANNLYAVASGTVRATTDGRVDEVLARGDVIAIPPWHGHVLHGVEDATLLRISDEPIMAKFGLLRHA
jgi:gentisate 1,2-dioxygenase